MKLMSDRKTYRMFWDTPRRFQAAMVQHSTPQLVGEGEGNEGTIQKYGLKLVHDHSDNSWYITSCGQTILEGHGRATIPDPLHAANIARQKGAFDG